MPNCGNLLDKTRVGRVVTDHRWLPGVAGAHERVDRDPGNRDVSDLVIAQVEVRGVVNLLLLEERGQEHKDREVRILVLCRSRSREGCARQAAVGRLVIRDAQSQLLEIVGALGAPGGLAR